MHLNWTSRTMLCKGSYNYEPDQCYDSMFLFLVQLYRYKDFFFVIKLITYLVDLFGMFLITMTSINKKEMHFV